METTTSPEPTAPPMPPTALAVGVPFEYDTKPIDHVGPGPWNPRKHRDDARLKELADSIGLHGVIQPIVVRPTTAKDCRAPRLSFIASASR